MSKFMKKWGLSLRVLPAAVGIIFLKLIFHYFNIEPFTSSPLLSSVIGGMTFLIGFILAGTMGDYKDSEKIPVEIVASLETIYEEGRYIKKLNEKFDLDGINALLIKTTEDLKKDLTSTGKKTVIDDISFLSEHIYKAEKMGIPAGWLGRIKSEQAQLKKNVLRMFQIKQTQFIPAAYAIVDIMVFMILTILVFIKLEPFNDSLLMVGIMSFIYIYMVFLIKDIDDPFELTKKSYADINLSMLDAFKHKVAKHKELILK
jgi:hypothetical protein